MLRLIILHPSFRTLDPGTVGRHGAAIGSAVSKTAA
jgi:hypothetical protein